MHRPSRPPSLYVVAALQLLAIAAMVAYWSLYFLAPQTVQVRPEDRCYAVFENSFPLADGWVVTASALGLAGTLCGRPFGLFFSIASGSAVFFLALMDLLFDLQHKIFVPLTANAVIELVIVITCLAGGPLVAGVAWTQRWYFLGVERQPQGGAKQHESGHEPLR